MIVVLRQVGLLVDLLLLLLLVRLEPVAGQSLVMEVCHVQGQWLALFRGASRESERAQVRVVCLRVMNHWLVVVVHED